ncbi:MAG: ChrR family anti-sigma-E factor [Alphaproteobacteria bacterium]|nr:ChrR family anti-sigma-E factor [Alphaproteobacteria bacterium]MCW5742675.1 ChrR family anti-sigma-E factor [Alphaproteobacteria bacterium]
MIRHPAPTELLLDYASGSLAEGPALLVATHLAYSGQARADVAVLEAAAGEMLASMPAEALDEDALARTLARIEQAPTPAPAAKPQDAARRVVGAAIPSALRRYLPDDARWRPALGGIEEIELPLGDKSYRATLMRIGAGRGLPVHRHAGSEYTLVLAGGFADGRDRFDRGDICVADPSVEHRPVADADQPCICLVVAEAPVVLTGLFGRLLNPFLKR